MMFSQLPKNPCTYLITNRPNGTLYTGVTSDLSHRMSDHRNGTYEGFSKRHGLGRLVYYEFHVTMDAAIEREKRIKEWHRAWKIRLILSFNPEWRDLYDATTGEILPGPADLQRDPNIGSLY